MEIIIVKHTSENEWVDVCVVDEAQGNTLESWRDFKLSETALTITRFKRKYNISKVILKTDEKLVELNV